MNNEAKSKTNVNDLYVDYRQLEPKTLLGTPLKSGKIQEKPKQ